MMQRSTRPSAVVHTSIAAAPEEFERDVASVEEDFARIARAAEQLVQESHP